VAATCSVSPSSGALDGIDSATAAGTLTTHAKAFATPPSSPYSWPPLHRWMILTTCYAWLVVLLMLYVLSRGSRLRPGLTPAVGILAFSLCPYSCGGGYAGGTGPGSPTLSSIMLSP